MMNNASRVRKNIFEYSVICIVASLLALVYHLFIVPNHFAPAGLNGIATMVQYKLGFSIGYFSLIINIPLCIFAYFFVNKEFAIKSLVFCLTYSGVYLLLGKINLTALQYITYSSAEGYTGETVFPCLIAGLFGGFTYGTCVRLNASTGGTDIVSKAISTKKPMLDFFWITFAINAAVAFVSLFVYGTEGDTFRLDYKPACLCILYCFMSSFLGGRILQGHKTAYKFIVITRNAEELEADILQYLHHSATRLYGKGVYSEDDKVILLCVVNKHQLADFKNLLKKYPGTFTLIETVNETVGNFKKIK